MMLGEEFLDYYDENMQFLGNASREEVHTKGYWHKTFHCWILRKEGSKESLLLQHRSLSKSVHPGFFDISAAGHYTSGESESDSIRELNEELGIEFDVNELCFIGIRKDSSYGKNQINKEFCYTYLLEYPLPPQQYVIQLEEVAGLAEVELETLQKLIRGENSEIEVQYFQPDAQGRLVGSHRMLRKEELVPHGDVYYLEICSLSASFLKGERHLKLENR